MKYFYLKIILFTVFINFSANISVADNLSKAEEFIKQAEITTYQDESYDYIEKARKYFKEEYDTNPYNIRALLGLSKTYQMTQNRNDAKLYVLKAYNLNPQDPKLQKEMGDFYYNFQEYSTAVEYYKLALSSGLLTDPDTNIQIAKCFEKLGDSENAYLYYQITNQVNPNSKKALKKINKFESKKHLENTDKDEEEPKYKYLYKNKPISSDEKNKEETDKIIEEINSYY